MKKITVIGAGYVGLANGLMLGISENVTLVDIDAKKIDKLNNKISPISDEYINKYIEKVNINYTTSSESYDEADYIFIATNTDYNDETGMFDVKSIESVINDIDSKTKNNKKIIIKSTIPIGYTKDLKSRFPKHNIIFSPEFLREGYALYDNLYPDRIVVGDTSEFGNDVANLLKKNILKENNVPIILMESKEAEVVKLFANTYLATRVSFVNELDTYCRTNNLTTANVLDAIGYDHRIGRHYFNPSFGYGGYCLPKDTKQLKFEYEKENIESPLIKNVVESNIKRKEFIVSEIEKKVKQGEIVGFYRIIAKKGINNFRSSATLDVINMLSKKNIDIVIYEPYIDNEDIEYKVISDIEEFKTKVDLIVANRIDQEINGLNIFTTDVYNEY